MYPLRALVFLFLQALPALAQDGHHRVDGRVGRLARRAQRPRAEQRHAGQRARLVEGADPATPESALGGGEENVLRRRGGVLLDLRLARPGPGPAEKYTIDYSWDGGVSSAPRAGACAASAAAPAPAPAPVPESRQPGPGLPRGRASPRARGVARRCGRHGRQEARAKKRRRTNTWYSSMKLRPTPSSRGSEAERRKVHDCRALYHTDIGPIRPLLPP